MNHRTPWLALCLLLGLLALLGGGIGQPKAATQDVSQRITFLNNAIASFRTAIELDPTNDDALFNLEYALGQLKEAAQQQAGPNQRFGQQGGAGLAEPGHGY